MRVDKNHWLYTRPVAHRGLHGNGIPENSYAAYQRAIDENYPIEIDLHLTKDGKVAVFHDDDLKRMTGTEGEISSKTSAELRELRLQDTDQTIPFFDELLKFVDGKVPLLIEVKNQAEKGIELAVIELLKGYGGEYAIQSFSPLILKNFKKYAPQMLRGQLSCLFPWSPDMGKLKKFALSHMIFNFLTKPDFISYHDEALPYKKAKKEGRPLLAWTIRDEEARKRMEGVADNIIFENIRPQ